MNPLKAIAAAFKQKEKPPPRLYKGSQNWTDLELCDFIMQLKQTITWTQKLSRDFDFENGFYGKVFRQTNPVINGTVLYAFDQDYATWNVDDYDDTVYAQLLKAAIEARDKNFDADVTQLDEWGSIVCFQTAVTTHDGAPIAESQCFVDESDVPPVDTWFYLKNNYYPKNLSSQALFCWIPKPFKTMMQNAIDVEIFDSYHWLEEIDPHLQNLIKSLK